MKANQIETRHFVHFALILVAAFSSACSKPLTAALETDFASLSGEDKTNIVLSADSPFLSGKVKIEPVSQGDQVNMASALNLSVLLDLSCYDRRGGAMVVTSAQVQAQRQKGLHLQAIQVFNADQAWLNANLEKIESDPCVRGVTREIEGQLFAAPNDSLWNNQIHMPFMNVETAWDVLKSSGVPASLRVRVAVVDSGVLLTHPDLAENLVAAVDGKIGQSFVDDKDGSDVYGHGTKVAGFIAAVTNNAIGVAGVTNNQAQILPLRVTNASGGVSLSAVANAIRFAADQGVEVINMSLGFNSNNAMLEDSIRYAISKGVFIAVAAGNTGQELSASGRNMVIPAAWAATLPGLVSVGNVDVSTSQLHNSSTFSSSLVEIAAPGANGNKGLVTTGRDGVGNFAYMSGTGTSFAAPMVAAAGAMVKLMAKHKNRTLSAREVESLILGSAKKITSLNSGVQMGRSLDLGQLMKATKALLEGGAETGQPDEAYSLSCDTISKVTVSIDCVCRPIANSSLGVSGTSAYSANSSICLAARHAGVFSGAAETLIKVRPIGVCASFEGSKRNGVQSVPSTVSSQAFVFEGMTARCDGGSSEPVPGSGGGEIPQGLQDLLEIIYVNFMGRLSDVAGRDYWARAVVDGGLSCRDLTRSFYISSEFQARQKKMSDLDYLKVLFLGALERPADSAGLNYWEGILKGGHASRSNVAEAFNESEEHRAICLKHGVRW